MAIFEFRDGVYVSTIYFFSARPPYRNPPVSMPIVPFDLMGMLWWDESLEGGAAWRYRYRFRYDAGTGKMMDDEKRVFEMSMRRPGEAEEEVVASFTEMMFTIAAAADAELDVMRPKSDRAEEQIAAMAGKPWAHISSVLTGEPLERAEA